MATKRLIWGDIAEEHLRKLAERYKGSFSGDAFERAAQEIEELPTVDAVEVVRCKECMYSRTPGNTSIRYDLPGTLTCMNPNSPCHYRHTLGDGYCPFGEKKDG